ncbi:MAG TPA: hypothetical protein VJS44_13400 [Pyrinomonadaceae bacterium]|nr:hypothetical protein [Pyrinomonadaceae bacterium]
MKKTAVVNRLMMLLALCALLSAGVLAKGKSEYVTLPQDVVIGGTLVKKGEYKLKFDEQSGELLLLKGKKVVARTSARLEKRDKDAQRTEFATTLDGNTSTLQSITFRGERESIVMHEKGGTTETPAAARPSTPSTNP